MAPETANQKRKRGRQTNASRDDNDNASKSQLTLTNEGRIATVLDDTQEKEMDEDSRPKKRGRPAKADVPSQLEPESIQPPPETKRKRGRAPLSQENTEVEGSENQASQPQMSRPRKRGRPSLTQANGETADGKDQGTIQDSTHPKKRGRLPQSQPNGEAVVIGDRNPILEDVQLKKRGRPSRETKATGEKEVAAEEADDEDEGNSSLLRRSGRTRKSPSGGSKGSKGSPKETANEEPEEEPEEDSSFLRRSGRDRRSVGAWYKTNRDESADAERGEVHNKSKRRKKGRSSLHDAPTEKGQKPVTQPKKRGQRPLNGHPAEAKSATETQTQTKKGGRASLTGDGPGPSTKEHRRKRRGRSSPDHEASAPEDQPQMGRRRRSDPETRRHRRSPQTQTVARSSSPESDSAPPPYRHLTTRTRRVPLDTIQTKWAPLDAPSVSTVTTLLQSASRPILLRLNNPQRHRHAAGALNAVGKRLRSKLARGFPFPPATTSGRRDDELEFERITSGIEALGAQLDPLLHGVELLRRERDRAERDLEREYKVLGQLGANAQAEAREKRDQLRKMHVLVPPRLAEAEADDDDARDVAPAGRGAGKVFADLGDTELAELAGRVGNHMESMRGNLQQIDGVAPAMARSRALLRAALQPHLGREQMEGVVLG
ncbi:CENP-Q, a CENPA-CAD centromere complex subunit-domain-containing protein [Xylariaceae sp. FL0662B]|nr:CENP-Q, a CENPA-CAD centromere complex subunit-domain-containing protein [Xylariaceae sp. FL0662B]